jgi:hypothetical protein
LGAHKAYGPGITAASLGQVRFELARTAHLIVLRVDAAGDFEPFLPQADQPTERAAGVHTIEAPLQELVTARPTETDPRPVLDPVVRSPAPLVRAGRTSFPPAAGSSDSSDDAVSHYWLVIVADSAISLHDVLAGLEAFSTRTFQNVEASVRALPRELVGKRTRNWAAYYAVVQPVEVR